MKISDSSRYALTSCVVAALLAGCGGSQPPIGPPGATVPTAATVKQPRSWMKTGTSSSEDLIYATGGCGGVCVLSYPGGALVGSLATGYPVQGDCSDSAGNVFITNNRQVLEYAHGGTSPVATLSLSGDQASGCAVDPNTNNLAVVYKGNGADVAVFPDEQGAPTLYASQVDTSFFCGYDGSGNLFVSGYIGEGPGLSELAIGGPGFGVIAVSDKVGNPGQVQFDGSYLTYEGVTRRHVTISRLAIAGSKATIVGTTKLSQIKDFAYQSWIYDGHVLVPYSNGSPSASVIGEWNYPHAGKPVKLKHMGKPIDLQGVTVSVNPSR